MSIKFFGQSLIEHGVLDATQLREALEWAQGQNLTIGQIAVRAGYLSEDAVYSINRKQSHIDLPFGELAIQMELLTRAQFDEVFDTQQRSNRSLSQTLVHLGLVDPETVERLWKSFREDQEPYEAGEIHLPDALAAHPEAGCVLDLFPKLCRRVARLDVRVARGVPCVSVPDFDHQASVLLYGAHRLDVGLVGDRDFCAQLAAGACGFELDIKDDHLLHDGVGEFLNVLAGSAMGQLEREGIAMDLAPPRFDSIAVGGQLFRLACGTGHGALLLDPNPLPRGAD